jgi:autotransporter-associated beta strand protein
LATSGTGSNITVGAGGLVNFGALSVIDPTTGSTAFFKNGSGALALSGGAYTGGFTLNDGLVVAAGNNARIGAHDTDFSGRRSGSAGGQPMMAACITHPLPVGSTP